MMLKMRFIPKNKYFQCSNIEYLSPIMIFMFIVKVFFVIEQSNYIEYSVFKQNRVICGDTIILHVFLHLDILRRWGDSEMKNDIFAFLYWSHIIHSFLSVSFFSSSLFVSSLSSEGLLLSSSFGSSFDKFSPSGLFSC